MQHFALTFTDVNPDDCGGLTFLLVPPLRLTYVFNFSEVFTSAYKWFSMKFGTKGHVPLRINPNNSGDPWTFHVCIQNIYIA